ncbi:MAG: Peroxiredoxin, partial [uncultured Ramlibacter sp.]
PAGVLGSRRQRLQHRAQSGEGEGCRRRQDHRAVRPSGCVHSDLLGQARAGLRAEVRRAQEGRRRRDLVRERQRCVRHGCLGARPEDQRQGAHDGRRQRRIRQGHRPHAGPHWPRHGAAQHALFHAGQERQGGEPERRGARQVRGERRRHAAGAGPRL